MHLFTLSFISLSNFTKSGTEVENPKTENEIVAVNIASPLPRPKTAQKAGE